MSTFENQCYDINEILIEKKNLRVYERRKKLHYLIRKPPTRKNTILKDLSSCVIQRYNGYEVVKTEKKDCRKQAFEPIDIVYDPVEGPKHNIECFHMPKIHIAYRLKYSKRSKGIETLHAFQCYSCHKFHSTKNFLTNI